MGLYWQRSAKFVFMWLKTENIFLQCKIVNGCLQIECLDALIILSSRLLFIHYSSEISLICNFSDIWGLPEETIEKAKLCSCERIDSLNLNKADDDSASGTKKPHLSGDASTMEENGDADKDSLIILPVAFIRSEWPAVGDTPKQLLFEHCKRKHLPLATFSTVTSWFHLFYFIFRQQIRIHAPSTA